MKINVSKKNVLILILVFSIILCASGLCGFLLWKNNLSITIDSDATYLIGDTDFTLATQYTEMTETFILSFIFTIYGMFVGCGINTFILFCFTLVRLIVDNRGFFEYRKKKYEDKSKDDPDDTENNKKE